MLSSLDSPYIVQYFDSFLHDGSLFICMEYAPGGRCVPGGAHGMRDMHGMHGMRVAALP